ncbi:MAG: glycerol acyltransferase, partial [Rhodoferax sp.]|nr:glycerol acyltransferase [Rhodoferax sp.]
RWCGGIPVRRNSANGVIADMARRLQSETERGARWWLVIAPEGTRKAGDGWRSGFYHIACTARVPIGLAYFNFQRREIGVTTFLMPSGDIQADLRQIECWYAEHAVGRYPALAAPVRVQARR